MVHRSSDSRLLTSLLSHEKDYSKSFQSLLDSSLASINSLVAYASASPPPTSSIILSVTHHLVTADDALRQYSNAVNVWREYLKNLKTLEDHVGNVMRDREILVTRVLKLSKSSEKGSQASNRNSLLLSRTQTQSSATDSLLLDTDDIPVVSASYAAANTPDFPLSSSVKFNKKLAAAQAELQACEAHLAEKERELEKKREAVVREGLALRVEAMVQCGLTWIQIGREVEGVLPIQGITPSFSVHPDAPQSSDYHSSSDAMRPQPPPHPTPPSSASAASRPDSHSQNEQQPGHRPSSASLSSISPSQSASQIGVNSESLFSTEPHGTSRHIYEELETAQTPPESQSQTPAVSILAPTPSLPQNNSSRMLPDRTLDLETAAALFVPHQLSHRITEEDLGFAAGTLNVEDDSDDEAARSMSNVQVVENPRFASSPSLATSTLAPPRFPSKVSLPRSIDVDVGGAGTPSSSSSPTKAKKTESMVNGGGGSKLLGSIRGLFVRKATSDVEKASSKSSVPKRKDKTRPALVSIPVPSSIHDDGQTTPVQRYGQLRTTGAAPRERTTSESGTITRGRLQKKPTARRSISGEGSNEAKRQRRRSASLDPDLKLLGDANELLTKRANNSNGGRTWASDTVASDDDAGIQVVEKSGKKILNGTAKRGQDSQDNLSRNSSLRSAASVSKAKKASPTLTSTPASQTEVAARRSHTASRTLSTTPTTKAAKRASAPASTSGMSLMSIVENVAIANQAGWRAADSVLKGDSPEGQRLPPPVPSKTQPSETHSTSNHKALPPMAFIPRAPGSVLKPDSTSMLAMEDSVVGSLPPLPLAINSHDLRPKSASAGKYPLRSALRNPSRSPSPVVVEGLPATSSTLLLNTAGQQKDEDDNASISSYETGIEAFDDDEQRRFSGFYSLVDVDQSFSEAGPSNYPGALQQTTEQARSSDVSASSASTEIPLSKPTRRKSVRVSLQPTFSPTPPAFEDDELRHQPWSRNIERRQDNGWADSSDEEVEYSRARKLLGRTR